MTRVLVFFFVVLGAGGCNCGSTQFDCNVYYGTKDGKLEADTTTTKTGTDIADAKIKCQEDPSLQEQAKNATGSTTLICECGDSP